MDRDKIMNFQYLVLILFIVKRDLQLFYLNKSSNEESIEREINKTLSCIQSN